MTIRRFWPLLVLLASPAQATLISVLATGTVAEVDDPDSLLPWMGLTPGATQVAVQFTYDDATPPDGYGPGIAMYPAQPISMEIDGLAISHQSNDLTLFNDWLESPSSDMYYDAWQAGGGKRERNAPLPDLVRSLEFVLWSAGTSAPITALTTTELVAPAWPGNWQHGELFYQVMLQEQDSSTFTILAQMRADVASVVATPAPASIFLLTAALGFMGVARRSRSDRRS